MSSGFFGLGWEFQADGAMHRSTGEVVESDYPPQHTSIPAAQAVQTQKSPYST